jgi:hypothetical protein
MADYCRTCSIVLFGKDFKELADLLPANQYTKETGALALCECCGPIVVDVDGKRMSKDFHPECDCEEHLDERGPDADTP